MYLLCLKSDKNGRVKSVKSSVDAWLHALKFSFHVFRYALSSSSSFHQWFYSMALISPLIYEPITSALKVKSSFLTVWLCFFKDTARRTMGARGVLPPALLWLILFGSMSAVWPLNPDDPNVCSHWERSVPPKFNQSPLQFSPWNNTSRSCVVN